MVNVKLNLVSEKNNNSSALIYVDPIRLISQNEYWYIFFKMEESKDNTYEFIVDNNMKISTITSFIIDLNDNDNPSGIDHYYRLYDKIGIYSTYDMIMQYGDYNTLKYLDKYVDKYIESTIDDNKVYNDIIALGKSLIDEEDIIYGNLVPEMKLKREITFNMTSRYGENLKLLSYYDDGSLDKYLDIITINRKQYKGWLKGIKYDTEIDEEMRNFNLPIFLESSLDNALRLMLIYNYRLLSNIDFSKYSLLEKYNIRAIIGLFKGVKSPYFKFLSKEMNIYNNAGFIIKDDKAIFYNISKINEEKMRLILLKDNIINMDEIPKRSQLKISRKWYNEMIENLRLSDINYGDFSLNSEQTIDKLMDLYESLGFDHIPGIDVSKYPIDIMTPKYENIDLEDILNGNITSFYISLYRDQIMNDREKLIYSEKWTIKPTNTTISNKGSYNYISIIISNNKGFNMDVDLFLNEGIMLFFKDSMLIDILKYIVKENYDFFYEYNIEAYKEIEEELENSTEEKIEEVFIGHIAYNIENSSSFGRDHKDYHTFMIHNLE